MSQKRKIENNSKHKSQKGIIIICATILLAAVILICFLYFPKNENLRKIRLEEGYYGTTEAKDIDRADYEQLIRENKSFVLMVDNEGCITTAKMREMMNSFPDSMKFTYYRILWPETKETNIREYVKYFPSIIIVENGKITSYLSADKDEDAKYYNNDEDLQNWLKSHIEF